MVLEKTLESPLDCKEIQPVHSEGDLPWDFFGRNDAKAETPVLWPWARLSDFTFTFYFHALEKEMATHSSVLAWRIPGMGEPGGLPSMGSHRVGHSHTPAACSFPGENARSWEALGEARPGQSSLSAGALRYRKPVGEGTTRRGTATPVHRPQRPAGSTECEIFRWKKFDHPAWWVVSISSVGGLTVRWADREIV